MHTAVVKQALKASCYILILNIKRQDKNNSHRFPCGNKLYVLHFPYTVQFFLNKMSEILKQMQLYDSIKNV